MKFFALTLPLMMILPWISMAQTTESNMEKVVRKVQVIHVANGDAVVTDTLISNADPNDTILINTLLQLYGIDTLSLGDRTVVKRVIIPNDGESLEEDVLKIAMDGISKRIVLINGEIADPGIADSIIMACGVVESDKVKVKKITVKIEDVGKKEMSLLQEDKEESRQEELPVENLAFFPNPVQGEFHLSFSLPHKGTALIRVMDQNGKVVFKERMPRFSGVYSRSVDLTGKAAGLYFLVIEQNGKAITKKLILQ